MPPPHVPTDPLDAYKCIIDGLVAETSQSVSSRLIEKESIFGRTEDSAEANALVRSLTVDQRRVLARMLEKERSSTIHDVLANLTWWLDCTDVKITFKGAPMPFDVTDFGMHGDYIHRLDGGSWPNSAGRLGEAPPEADENAGESSWTTYERKNRKLEAEKDAAITDLRCPHCGAPCPSYRKTCKACRKPVR